MKCKGLVLSLALAAVLALSAGQTHAAFDEWAVGFKTGTLGLGGELTTNLAPQLNLRGSLQWLDFGFDAEIDDIDYDLDVEFLNPLVAIDWHPFDTSFRICGGILFNGMDIALDATSDTLVEIGDNVYDTSEYGSLRGESDLDDIAPYVGIGFGNALSRDGRWGFTADFGVAFIGSPNVDLRVTGSIDPALVDQFTADLAAEEREIEDELDKFRFYPVLSASLYYRF